MVIVGVTLQTWLARAITVVAWNITIFNFDVVKCSITVEAGEMQTAKISSKLMLNVGRCICNSLSHWRPTTPNTINAILSPRLRDKRIYSHASKKVGRFTSCVTHWPDRKPKYCLHLGCCPASALEHHKHTWYGMPSPFLARIQAIAW